LQETFLRKHWAGIQQADAAITVWDSGIDVDLLRYTGEKSVAYPQEFVSLLLIAEKIHTMSSITK
jgi:hypothetical protein